MEVCGSRHVHLLAPFHDRQAKVDDSLSLQQPGNIQVPDGELFIFLIMGSTQGNLWQRAYSIYWHLLTASME
jgi:hypothetical protein